MVAPGETILYGGKPAKITEVHDDGRVSILVEELTVITTSPGLDPCWDATAEVARARRDVLTKALHGSLKGK